MRNENKNKNTIWYTTFWFTEDYTEIDQRFKFIMLKIIHLIKFKFTLRGSGKYEEKSQM